MYYGSSLTDPKLIALLKSGAVGVLPTDTVYGLVTRVAEPAAVERLYALKHREHQPGTLIAASATQLHSLGIDSNALTHAAQYWPAPLSIIVPSTPELAYLDLGVGSLAVRVPMPSELRALLEQTGPLITTSANAPGQPTAKTIAEAEGYFGDQVDFYIAATTVEDGPPSTIARFTGDDLEVIRQGAYTIPRKDHL